MKVDKVTELIKLVLKVNSKDGIMEKRESEITGNKPTVFAYFMGHTNTLNIRVSINGWHENVMNEEMFWVNLNEAGLEEYERCKACLLKLLEANNES